MNGSGQDDVFGTSSIHLTDGDEFTIEAFRVPVFDGEHSPSEYAPDLITEPLTPPCNAKAYRAEGWFTVHVTHPAGFRLADNVRRSLRTPLSG